MDRPLVQWITASLVLLIASLILNRLAHKRLFARFARKLGWLFGIALGILILSYAGPRLLTPLYGFRPKPQPSDTMIFQGIRYIRDVRTEPRPLVIHIITVDLDTPGLGFLVTPADKPPGHHLSARTTSEYLDEFDL